MAFDRMTDDMNIISKLPDEPNDAGGMTAAVLKATFDKAGMLAKTAINKLIAALGASTAAGNIGFSPTAGVNKTNIQAAIENVQSQIAGVALGSIPDGSITAQQLAASAVTAEKVADRALVIDVSDQVALGRPTVNGDYAGGSNQTRRFLYAPSLGIVFFDFEVDITAAVSLGDWIWVAQTGLPMSSWFQAYYQPVCCVGSLGSIAGATVQHCVDPVGVLYRIAPLKAIPSGGNEHFYVSGWYFTDGPEVT